MNFTETIAVVEDKYSGTWWTFALVVLMMLSFIIGFVFFFIWFMRREDSDDDDGIKAVVIEKQEVCKIDHKKSMADRMDKLRRGLVRVPGAGKGTAEVKPAEAKPNVVDKPVVRQKSHESGKKAQSVTPQSTKPVGVRPHVTGIKHKWLLCSILSNAGGDRMTGV